MDIQHAEMGMTVYGARFNFSGYGMPFIVVEVHSTEDRLVLRKAGENDRLWARSAHVASEEEWSLVIATKGIS